MAADEFLSREEILAGLAAKRAKTLLFLIESRTAHLMTRSRHAMGRFLTEEATRDLAFSEAFSLGRRPPPRPTIRDLERHTRQWADLIPGPPRARGAFERALAIWRAVYGEEHPQVATAHNNVGGVLHALGELAAARAACERALHISEKSCRRAIRISGPCRETWRHCECSAPLRDHET
jgi:hypothetical protein